MAIETLVKGKIPKRLAGRTILESGDEHSGTFRVGSDLSNYRDVHMTFVILDDDGVLIRRRGKFTGWHESYVLTEDDNDKPAFKVARTTLFFYEQPPLTIVWRETAEACAEYGTVTEF